MKMEFRKWQRFSNDPHYIISLTQSSAVTLKVFSACFCLTDGCVIANVWSHVPSVSVISSTYLPHTLHMLRVNH